jgi:hypothetical protein
MILLMCSSTPSVSDRQRKHAPRPTNHFRAFGIVAPPGTAKLAAGILETEIRHGDGRAISKRVCLASCEPEIPTANKPQPYTGNGYETRV